MASKTPQELIDEIAAASAARSVFERVCAIVAEMPAIGKNQRNEQQQFMYRGHDDVMNELNPLLSKHGVFFAPRVLERTTDTRQTRSGGVMYEVNLLVEYTFYGPKGDSFVASAWGEGTDSGDKSTNKAMTMALKNVLAQTFAVSTAELSHDTDGDTPEATTGRGSQRTRAKAPRGVSAKDVKDWRDAKFDPALSLADGAPAGWEQINDLALSLDYTLVEWIALAVVRCYGTSVKDMTDDRLKSEAGRRIANALARVRDELYADGDFPPPEDAEYARVFTWAFGVQVDMPDETGLLEDAQADTDGQESADESEAGQNPLQEVSDAQGGSGHVGTGAPDE